jgi:hypothetical protein
MRFMVRVKADKNTEAEERLRAQAAGKRSP